MDENAATCSADVRFGVAVPDNGRGPPSRPGLGTAEFSLEAFRRAGAAWEGELSLRLGGPLVDPACTKACYARALAECRDLAEPLAASGRLSALLLIFPASFRYGTAERRRLDLLLGDLRGFPLAAAFLGAAWYGFRLIEGFKRMKVALCLLDLPPGEHNPPQVDLATAPLTYLRRLSSTSRSGTAGLLGRLEAAAVLADRVRVLVEGPEAEAEAAELAHLWEKRTGAGAGRGIALPREAPR